MVHRNNFEAVNRCLCDIIGNDAPCGGRVFVCCGDFRQIPPVIPGGGKSTIVQASIRSSSLWENFELRNLSHPQRDAGDADYSRFIDRICDGEVESTDSVDGDTQLMKLRTTLNHVCSFSHPSRASQARMASITFAGNVVGSDLQTHLWQERCDRVELSGL